MPMVAVAAVAAGVFAVGTAVSINAQNKQTKALKSATRFERQKASLQSARQKMEAVREGRRAMAEVQQNAENQGASGSSIGEGGAGSVYSQTQSNLSFLDRYGYYSDQASKFGQKAANYGAQAGMWGQVAQVGAQAFSAAGGVGAFKGPPPPPVKG
jgi:Flp pilus assembly protein TadB